MNGGTTLAMAGLGLAWLTASAALGPSDATAGEEARASDPALVAQGGLPIALVRKILLRPR